MTCELVTPAPFLLFSTTELCICLKLEIDSSVLMYSELELPRYKYVVTVVMGEMKGEGVR